MIKRTKNLGNLFGVIQDTPVLVCFWSVCFCLGYDSHAEDLMMYPFNYRPMEVRESKIPCFSTRRVVFSNMTVPIYQSSNEVRPKSGWDDFKYLDVSFSLELVPSELFNGPCEGPRGNAKPVAFTLSVSLDGVGASNGYLEFMQMFFIPLLEGDSKGSSFVVPSVVTDVSIGKEKSEPVCFGFSVDVLEKGCVKGVGAGCVRIGSPWRMDKYKPSQYCSLAGFIFFRYLKQRQAGLVVLDDTFDGKDYPFHRYSPLYLCNRCNHPTMMGGRKDDFSVRRFWARPNCGA